MAFTTIRVSPAKLMGVVRAKKWSKSDLMRQVGVSRESVLKWTNEKKPSAGVKPELFRKMLDVLKVDAASIEASDARQAAPLSKRAKMAIELIAKETGMTPDEIAIRVGLVTGTHGMIGGRAATNAKQSKRSDPPAGSGD